MRILQIDTEYGWVITYDAFVSDNPEMFLMRINPATKA